MDPLSNATDTPATPTDGQDPAPLGYQADDTDYSPPPSGDQPAQPLASDLQAKIAEMEATIQRVTDAYAGAVQQNRDLMQALKNGTPAPAPQAQPPEDPYSVFESPEIAANTEKSVMAVLKKMGFAQKLEKFNPEEFEGVKQNLKELHRKQTSAALEAQDAREKAELSGIFGGQMVESLHQRVVTLLNADAQRGISTSYRDGFARIHMEHVTAEKKRDLIAKQTQGQQARQHREQLDSGQVHIPRGQSAAGQHTAPQKFIPREIYSQLTLEGKLDELDSWFAKGYSVPPKN